MLNPTPRRPTIEPQELRLDPAGVAILQFQT